MYVSYACILHIERFYPCLKMAEVRPDKNIMLVIELFFFSLTKNNIHTECPLAVIDGQLVLIIVHQHINVMYYQRPL